MEHTLPPTDEQESFRERVLVLVREKKIKYSEKDIKKAPEANLERIYKEYELKLLEETNAKLSEELVEKFSELLSYFNWIDDDNTMKSELDKNTLLKDDLKKLVGHVTPYIPLIGLLSGGITVGKHILQKDKPETEPKKE